ncbi:MAG: fasciclin domain-containing protein [Phycisphaerae bacterium]|nr:fasciclin domain-containing protein [Phycisphaerae bacterium]
MRTFPVWLAVAALAAAGCGPTHHDSATKGGSSCGAAGTSADIVDTAVGAGEFNTLVTAVKAAGLVETLKSDGPFTVFAPTDAAFDKLPDGTVEALLADKAKLKAVLLYHVVPGKVTAEEVVKLHEAETAGGAHLPIKVSHGTVHVGTARVTQTDVMASNGVIHVIDSVLIPPK